MSVGRDARRFFTAWIWGTLLSTIAFADGAGYYRRLNYRQEVIDTGDGVKIRYRTLTSWPNEVVINANRVFRLDLKLYLLENDRFILAYQERYRVRDHEGAPWRLEMTYPQYPCPLLIRGNWTAPEEDLLTDQGFHASRAWPGGFAGLTLTFDRPMLSLDALKKAYTFEFTQSADTMVEDLGSLGCPKP